MHLRKEFLKKKEVKNHAVTLGSEHFHTGLILQLYLLLSKVILRLKTDLTHSQIQRKNFIK